MFEVAVGIFRKGDKHEFEALLILLENVDIIPMNTMFSINAASYAGKLKKKGFVVDDMDLLIAATMLNFGISKIVTGNKKHFSKIPGIEVISY